MTQKKKKTETDPRIGKKVPAFKLISDEGEWVSNTLLKGKAYVLYFYPKDNTPGCTQETCDFGDRFPKFKKKSALIFGVSKDSVESHVKFRAKYRVPFPLLSDESGQTLEKFGVWKEKSLYGRKFMGIERTTFLISGEGKILKVWPKVKVNGHAEEVLQALIDLDA